MKTGRHPNKFLFTLLFVCALFSVQAQTPEKGRTLKKDTLQVSDSLKVVKLSENLEGNAPFKRVLKDSVFFHLKKYEFAARIDSLWLQEMLDSKLYEEMQAVVQNEPYQDEISQNLSTETLKARLVKIDAKTPFKVVYNSSIESVIRRYLKWNKQKTEQLMALSAYYFPMFEESLAKYNIPLEMKYLAIVESALQPRAKSWVGATGLWQFMFATGKMHDLGVSSYVDERMDPILATQAACEYLSTLYNMFGDWNLALASYNAGPGNVAQAIRRSGGNKNYWEIRRYLPRETAGYVPAFFASMYLFEYAEEHGLQAKMPPIAHFETDTIHVKKLLTFEHISEVIGTDMELLEFLNPSYKLNIIPYIEDENYYLRLPIRDAGLFVANEAAIYGYAQKEIASREKPLPRYLEADDKIRYRVRSGDVLGTIAEKYGVRVSQIKNWNHLRSSRIRIGQRLTIYPRKPVVLGVSTKKQQQKKPSLSEYVVQKGDSLWSISQKFPGISVQNIQKWNDISGTNLKPGMKLKLSEG
ncbi:MAG TPA: LysM peptidoglycan-binding domain-containing protein [Flavobacteriaceae bacterium]|nr:LysM peptidoglycan-binding domain-containing protein [Flavobacteriaceae bacterium]